MSKTTTAKTLARTQNVYGREAEWQSDTDSYLQEKRQWAHGGLHHEHLCQQMFLHAAVTSQSEHNCGICLLHYTSNIQYM